MITRTAARFADPRTNSAASSPKRANGSYTLTLPCVVWSASNATMVRVMLRRRADRVAAYADLLHEGGTKPPEVSGKEARGKLDDLAHRLKSKRPQPGRWSIRAP